MARHYFTAHLTLTALLFLPVLTSCGGDAASDSDQPQWSVVEELRIGDIDDPEQTLSTVGALVVDDQNRIYVAQPQLGTIRVFDDAGRTLRYIGSRGQAQGEFDRVYTIGFVADTLYAIDLGLRRVSYFSLEGEHLRSAQVSAPPVTPPFFPSMPFAVFADGSMVIGTAFPPSIPPEALRRVPQLRIDGTGTVLDTVTWIGYERTARRANHEGRPLSVGSPLSDDAFAMFSDDGTRVATLDRTVAPGAGTASFGVTMSDGSGDTIYSRRYEYVPVPVDASVIDSIVEERANALSGAFEDPREAPGFVRSAMFLPVYYPPVSAAQFSDSGEFWVRREALAGQDQTWMVLDEGGEPIAHAALPEGLQVMVIGRDALWGVVFDEFEVPYVVRYRVVRGATAE
ncbi:MAG: hypothetical protein OEO79_03860 [Gemmatimonadota bacterium]|nr:hypothetical protein [Gemmatimonadota bacterium]MDH3421675.1 hypothetical protein [Gemmatimonadota bacterium]